MTRPSAGMAWRLLAALASGAGGTLAFAPFRWWPLALLSLATLFALWCQAGSARWRFVLGFVWGLGLFGAGVSWVYVSLHVYGNMPALLAGLATFLFCCYLALYPAAAGTVSHWISRRLHVDPLASLLLIVPACFALFEYLRGWVVTGFPWLTFGYSQAPGGSFDGPLSGFAPLAGVHAISWLLALSAAMLIALAHQAVGFTLPRRRRLALIACLLTIWGVAAGLRCVEWSTRNGPAVTVALLQGNVPQELKWRADQQESTLRNYAELVQSTNARLIVLPETALPGFIDQMPAEYLRSLAQHAAKNGGDLIAGVPVAERAQARVDPYRYANSAVSMGLSPSQRYDKQHLVAFGEFIPPLFSWVYRWLKIPLAGFTPGDAGQVPMKLAGSRVAVNICYEDAFGREIALQAADAGLLVNMSNMAWYGESFAADQHAQFSQMRALENGRWMLRATNTGVTAAIDERGAIVKQLPQFTRGVLEVDAQPRQGVTPYTRFADLPALLLVLLSLAGGFALGATNRSKVRPDA